MEAPVRSCSRRLAAACQRVGLVVAIALLAHAAAAAPRILPQKTIDDRARVDDVINDIVLVGIGEHGRAIVLATPARREQPWYSLIEPPPMATDWRFRAIPLREGTD